MDLVRTPFLGYDAVLLSVAVSEKGVYPMSARMSLMPWSRSRQFVLVLLLCFANTDIVRSDGIVVETVKPGSPAEQAGVRAGDRLVEADGKRLLSPPDWLVVQKNTGGKDTIVLKAMRGQETVILNLSLTTQNAGLEVRPDFSPPVLALYEQGRQALAAKESETAIARWQKAAKAAENSKDSNSAAWLYGLDLPIMEQLHPDSVELANLMSEAAGAFWNTDEEGRDQAEKLHLRALEIRERLVPDTEVVVKNLLDIGTVLWVRDKWQQARDYFTRALPLAERVCPHSKTRAFLYHRLANTCRQLGDLGAAVQYVKEGLAASEQIPPGSAEFADFLKAVEAEVWNMGQLQEAIDAIHAAIQVVERNSANTMQLAELYERAGYRYWVIGDPDMSQCYLEKALVIAERLEPRSAKTLSMINLQGRLHIRRGHLDAAEKCFRRILDMKGTRGFDSLTEQNALSGMGTVALKRKDYQPALDYSQKAAQILEKTYPRSRMLVGVYRCMGDAARGLGKIELAREHYTRAHSLSQRCNIDEFMAEAHTLADLGVFELETGQARIAVSLLTRAADLAGVERQKVQSPETRQHFSDSVKGVFTNLMRANVALNNLPAAFAAVERGRTRGLVEMLRERAVGAEAEVPAELLSKKDELDRRRDALHQELGALDPAKDAPRAEQLQKQMEAIQAERRRWTEEVRKASPRYAALQYPKPLNLEQIQELLEPGALCLEYEITKDETYLFTVTKTQLKLHRIRIQGEELRDRVEHYRQLLSSPHRDAGNLGKQLYDLLLRPAQAEIKQARRILICPDGSLHRLPFGALVPRLDTGTKTSQRPGIRYFIEDKPLHVIGSMSLYGSLRDDAASAASPSQTLLALGDPAYDSTPEVGNRAETEFEARGAKLTPLPYTRHEVETLGSLYGQQAIVRLGREATESAIKEEGKQASILHLACHGLLNDGDPLSSALALTPSEGEKDDGLLRAYEVMDKLRLNADLVVLSACQSGLGKLSSSEGVVGMTRAFLHAGAKSVVVSLWNVADESTAYLMAEFHRQLKAGKSKDEALRLAQISLLRPSHPPSRDSKSFSHPFFWAPFLLVGDWKYRRSPGD